MHFSEICFLVFLSTLFVFYFILFFSFCLFLIFLLFVSVFGFVFFLIAVGFIFFKIFFQGALIGDMKKLNPLFTKAYGSRIFLLLRFLSINLGIDLIPFWDRKRSLRSEAVGGAALANETGVNVQKAWRQSATKNPYATSARRKQTYPQIKVPEMANPGGKLP